MDNRFRIDEDSRLLREMRKLSQTELADQLGLGIATINRWENMHKEPKEENFEKFYAYAYHSGIRFNRIKEQFYREELENGTILLFHGAKKMIDGEIRADASRHNNDFGQGFYMGETFRQAALFVSNFESSCVYCIRFRNEGLREVSYSVNTEWMLTVACFRDRLKGRISAKKRRFCTLGGHISANYIPTSRVIDSVRRPCVNLRWMLSVADRRRETQEQNLLS